MGNIQGSKQPNSLPLLFFAEMTQRFSYWGIQSLLVLFLIHRFLFSYTKAYYLYGAFTAFTFSLSIVGGLVADRFFGFKPTLLLGILFTLIGNLLLAFSGQETQLVLLGLACVCYGTGIFLPCNSNLLGTFYAKKDLRRDRGFTLLYIGTNAGGLTSPIVYGFVYQYMGWHVAFGLGATVAMIWLVFYLKFKGVLDHVNQLQPQSLNMQSTLKQFIYFIGSMAMIGLVYILFRYTHIAGYLLSIVAVIALSIFVGYAFLNKAQRWNILLLILMIGIALLFFACELQTNNSLLVFAHMHVKRDYFGITLPASAFASFEPGFVIISSAILLKLWKVLDKHQPAELNKMIIGLSLEALAFVVLALAAKSAASTELVSMSWLLIASLLLGAGEVCIMPPLIAAITHRAPHHLRGTLMGGLYLAIAFSGYLSGIIATHTTHASDQALGFFHVYLRVFYFLGAIILLLLVAKIFYSFTASR